MATVDFYFDFQSPWAYLASTQMEALCAQHGATLHWRPVELESVRTQTDREAAPYSPGQLRYLGADITRWAQRYGVRWSMPVVVSTTPALRGCFLARDAGCEAAYIHRVFRARWADGADLSDETVLREVAADCGLPFDTLWPALDGDAGADRLDLANGEAAGRGVFGVPMTFVDEAMFWGNDRLDFVAEALAGTGS